MKTKEIKERMRSQTKILSGIKTENRIPFNGKNIRLITYT